MFLPYGTDAPVYHPPIATVGIIVINSVLFLATGMGYSYAGEYDWLILQFDRINPLQWVTAAFMHASWGHLIGNMIFLWCFGLVIEGKLGWHRFSWLYLGLAMADGAIGQIPMFVFSDGHGGALGASGVIFAMLAIAMIWAPQNDIHFFYIWTFYFMGTVEIPIIVVGCFYISLQVLQLAFIGWHMSTPMLHLLGASVGIPFAIYMLQTKRVDCEGWDLFSRLGWNGQLRRKHFNLLWVVGRFAEKHPKKTKNGEEEPATAVASSLVPAKPNSFVPLFDQQRGMPRDPCAAAINALNQAVAAGKVDDSIAAMEELRRGSWTAAVPEMTLVAFANLLSKHSKHQESLLPLQLMIRRKSRYANDACLQVARIEWKRKNFDAARSALQGMKQPMSDKHRELRAKLVLALKRETSIQA